MSDNVEQHTHDQQVPLEEEHRSDTVQAEDAKDQQAHDEKAADPCEVELAELTEKLRVALDENDRLTTMYLRLRADFDNFRRRKNEEVETLKSTAAADLVVELLPVIDNLERAVGSATEDEGPLAKGVRLVLRQLQDVLQARGVEVIPAVGCAFDPQLHEAVGQVAAEGDCQPGTVVDEVLKGYRMGERVLRASMVRVAG